jgi:hypothetical protein
MKNSKAILTGNLESFVVQILEASDEGWEIDPSNPPTMLGYNFECIMLRDSDIKDEAKLTRAEILANARAAKAAKREQS